MADYVPCPKCSSNKIQSVGFTWWGGIIGPKILSHVKCQDCGTTFNGKTGKSNTTGIIIYSVVVFVIAFAIFFALALAAN